MKKRLKKIIVALVIFAIAMVLNILNLSYTKFAFNIKGNEIEISIANILFIISYIIVGFEIVKKAFRNITRGKIFDENFLMTVATIGAFFVGEFPEAVTVMLFYQIGELFQSFAVDKSRKSIASLMDIRPDYANLVDGDDIKKVKPDTVKIGDIILIKPGEKIPLDGIIIEGESFIDTKALTGESVPRSVKSGENVLSGTINQTGILKVKVEKKFGESTVSKILDLVENASSKKSKSENFISKFARYYTPIVVIIAVILAIVPPLIIKDSTFQTWIYRALSFLVVSCPCALVISIPLSFFGGIGRCSKEGILVKGSNYLEALANADIAVFDKTGTLTQGVFDVQKIETNSMDENEFLKLVAHCEHYSNHPIADSIKKKYGEEIQTSIISDVDEIPGHGISAVIENKKVLVGNSKLMEKYDIEFAKQNEIGTIVYVAVDGKFEGYILINDEVKKDSKQAISDLKKSGIRKTIMLTGDKKEVGENVAKELELHEVYTDLLPTDKVEKVKQLISEKNGHNKNSKLFFVGDGINDSPVLALSDIGIAMGGLGSDSAIEAADIVIMTDEPSKINTAIKISKKTLRIAKENIYFAIIIKILVLLLSALGVATMWMAVFADVGVSIIAILNSMRVLYGKE